MTPFEITKPIKNLAGGALDANRGPYFTVEEACLAIPSVVVEGVNFREGKQVDIGEDGVYRVWWWQGGYDDADLVEMLIKGDNGDQGFSILSGAGVPYSSLGVNGDSYLNTSNGDVYLKSGGSWGSPTGNIRGAQGIQGFSILSGAGVPSDSLGSNTQTYLDTTTGDTYIKSSGTWAINGNIRGIQGGDGLKSDMTRTSTTENSIGSGSKTFGFTESLNLGWLIGTRLRAFNSDGNLIEGNITALTSSSVTINSIYIEGSGTYSAWNLSISGVKGADGTGTGDVTTSAKIGNIPKQGASKNLENSILSEEDGAVTANGVFKVTEAPTDADDVVRKEELDLKVASSEKGSNNGVATLDPGGKVPASQLPNSVMELKGSWNANTNTPTLADGTGNAGDVWEVTTAGTVNLGSGNITFKVGDWAVYGATGIWFLSKNSNEVTSVAGKTGAVTLVVADVSGAEDTSNKVTDLTSPNNTKYPTVQATVDGLALKAPIREDIVTVSANKTFDLTDENKFQDVTANSSLTVPLNSVVAFPIGTEIEGAIRDTITGTFVATGGVTIINKSLIVAGLTAFTLKKVATDTWLLTTNASSGGGGTTILTARTTLNDTDISTNKYKDITVTGAALNDIVDISSILRKNHINQHFLLSGEAISTNTVRIYISQISASYTNALPIINPSITPWAIDFTVTKNP